MARQDTYDLRNQMYADENQMQLHAHADAANYAGIVSDEEHSVLEDDSIDDEGDQDEYMDEDDGSSDLSIPDESINFDLVYSLHSFAATVEGQANVVKGDSLFLMDDSNSYWWLVRVLKTQEVGYIPAENIETPFERLARLNKHRNVDLAQATEREVQEGRLLPRKQPSRQGVTPSPNQRPPSRRRLKFNAGFSVHRYPPAVWNDEEEEEDVEWDDEGYEDEDPYLLDDVDSGMSGMEEMEPDDGMAWDDSAVAARQQQNAQARGAIPQALVAGSQQQQILQQQQQQLQQQQQMLQKQQQDMIQQQRQREMASQQAQAQAQAQQQALRGSSSREHLTGTPDSQRRIDPAEATETRKLSVTPTIARDMDIDESESIRRAREEEEEARRRAPKGRERTTSVGSMGAPVSSASIAAAAAARPVASSSTSGGGKLRKESRGADAKESRGSDAKESRGSDAREAKGSDARETKGSDTDDDSTKKKKGGSMFSGLFGRKKDKKSPSITSTESDSGVRASEESMGLSQRSVEMQQRGGEMQQRGAEMQQSPTTSLAMQQQQRASVDPSTPQKQTAMATAGATTPPEVSQHASSLRQRDQQQQALYQQYLNRSPSSPPDLQPSYGLWSAPAVMPNKDPRDTSPGAHAHSGSTSSASGLAPPTSRPRPGSLILTPGSMDGQGVGVPELSVIRVFAGDHLETEATFKTVLLNASTTAGDLVRQAIQRFRLPAGDDASDYFLTVKQVEGGASAALRADERPLGVFESLVEAALEMPKVKRSSMASISSVASNLSMHPAISSLNMNDFTDDSAVKFYLNRRRSEGAEGSEVGEEDMDDTLIADMSHGDASMDSTNGQGRAAYLTVSTNNGNVPPERFSSPSFRFPLQLVIYPEDLPEDMVFDPQTEAIVFKNTIRDRAQAGPSPGVPQNMRRKVFIFPKNVTVAEVIELGLERFGILEGVVDGGDEVEDKMTKRRSMARVRYGLSVNTGGSENKELSPSSKVIDAFPRPPAYRTADKRDSQSKRRSMDSAMLLGTVDDVAPDDPVFVLRRSVTYRNSTAKHRISGALDEIALQKLHRESSSSFGSDHKPGPSGASGPSKAEIIAAQREAKRANQRAVLSAQTNSVRGVDVLLPGNAIIRSTRQDVSDKMRYSYVDQDGESYDISDIVAEEWRNHGAGAGTGSKDDALEGVLVRNKEGMAKLERVIGKIQKGKEPVGRQQPRMSAGSSEYSFDAPTSSTIEDPSRAQSATPISSASRMTTPTANDPKPSSRPGTTTPTAPRNRRNPSAASVLSDISRYATPDTHVNMDSPMDERLRSMTATPRQARRPVLLKDDFGVGHMMAVIEYRATQAKVPLAPLDPVDEMLFGRPMDAAALHPDVRDIYAASFKELEDVDKYLDNYLCQTLGRA